MIAHFIARDFRTYKISWILLALITWPMTSAVHDLNVFWHYIGLVYFYFGIRPQNSFFGSTLRIQNIMSRNYMLALPVKRKSMFLIIHYRCMIYWVPFISYYLATIYFYFIVKTPVVYFPRYVLILIYALTLFFGVVLIINLLNILMSLIGNSILTSRQRTIKGAMLAVLFSSEFIIMYFAFFSSLMLFISPLVPLVIVMVFAVANYTYARKLWLSQR